MGAGRLRRSTDSRFAAWRRLLAAVVAGALLHGLGVQAALACVPAIEPAHHAVAATAQAESAPCHDEAGTTRAACESHCRGEASNLRASPSLDLPAAAPPDVHSGLPPPIVVVRHDRDPLPPPPAHGPPLHLLFHRFLR